MLEKILSARSTADWLKDMRKFDVPAAPVNNMKQVFSEPPVAEREMIVEHDQPEVSRTAYLQSVKLDGGLKPPDTCSHVRRAYRRSFTEFIK